MLNRFLHEKHAVAEGTARLKAHALQDGRKEQVKKEQQAVNNLDSEMDAATNPEMLEKARRAQRGVLILPATETWELT